MEYTESIPYLPKPAKAFALAKTVLQSNNYRVVTNTPTDMSFSGGGLRSTNQNPILGATHIFFSYRNLELTLSAQLNGVANMTVFIWLFPLTLSIVLAVIFYVSGLGVEAVKTALYVWLPWVVLSPLMSILLKRRTENALQTLLHNMSTE